MAATSQKRKNKITRIARAYKRYSASGVTWIDIERPSAQTIKRLQKEYPIHPLDVEDILSPAQRPKLERHQKYLFLVFRFPQISGRSKKARATELDVVVGKNYLITFHDGDLRIITQLFSDVRLFKKTRQQLMSAGPDHLLYEVLQRLFNQIYKLTDRMSRNLDGLETRIFSHQKGHRSTINDIAELRRRVIDYRKVAKPQATFLRHIVRNGTDFMNPADKIYWHNLIEAADGQWELFDTYLDTINGLASTSDALSSFRLNQIFKLLTIISVLFLPATFVLDIFSRDTPGAPLADISINYWAVIGIIVIVEIYFLAFLRRKKII